MERLGNLVGLRNVYIKRDDECGKVWGGNKTRKLEFILAHALKLGKNEVLTFGGVGSNHATATAVYAHQLGLKAISMLMPQAKNPHICDKLLLSHLFGAELHYLNVKDRRTAIIKSVFPLLKHWVRTGSKPYVIPFGGSSVRGAVGYVNAAFELRQQICKGLLPEPDIIYVAMGSMGTSVGLTLGLKAANMKTRVRPVRVLDCKYSNARRFIALYNKTNKYLRTVDSVFPLCNISKHELDIIDEFFWPGYARQSREVIEAINRLKEAEGISLEGTYTGKAFAAMMEDAMQGRLEGKVVLFWNTCNSRDFSQKITDVDYRDLPLPFHQYF